MGCKVAGYGKALPDLVVTNDEMAGIVDTSDEWIVTRTGIHERRIAVGESSTDLAARAALQALERAGAAPEDVDLIVCMTITPDAVVPSQSCLLKVRLGATHAVAFDLNAACTGCIYGVEVASEMMEASALDRARAVERGEAPRRNVVRRALVVGVERLSRLTDWTDRATCVLFGDGAGAVVLEWDDEAPGVLASFLKNTDDAELSLACSNEFDLSTFPFGDPIEKTALDDAVERGVAGAAVVRLDEDELTVETQVDRVMSAGPFIRMHGQRVYKFATAAMAEAIEKVLERAGVSIDEVKCIVPHQANERIIKYAAKKVGKPMDLFQVSIGHVGNTSASSVLMALDDAYEAGRIEPGDKVILVGFGGGLTSGAILYEA